ncbi:tail tape measure protein [Yersinia phage vB_YenM_P778]
MSKFTVDEFVIELGLSDKVTKGLAKVEKYAATVANKIERNLNKAFDVDGSAKMNKTFTRIVRDSASASRKINQNLTKAFDVGAAGKVGIKGFESSANAAMKRIKKNFKDGFKIEPNGRGRPTGSGGTGGGRRPASGAPASPSAPRTTPLQRGLDRGNARIESMFNRWQTGGFQRTLASYGGQANNIRNRFQAGIQETRNRFAGTGNYVEFEKAMLKIVDAEKKLFNSLRQHDKEIQKSRFMQERFNSSLSNMIGGFATVYAAMELFTRSVEAGLARQSANMSAGAVFQPFSSKTGKDEEAAAKRMAYEFSAKIGQTYTETLKQLTAFAASAGPSMGIDSAKDFYKTSTVYARMRGLNNEQMASSTLAFEQMAGKGTISAQELKLQLANAMPGAEQLFAKALYGNDSEKEVSKLLSDMGKGLLKSSEVLPKVNAEMAKQISSFGGLEKIAKMTGVAIGNMHRASEQSLVSMEGGFDKSMGTLANAVTGFLDNSLSIADAMGEGIGWLMGVLTGFVEMAANTAMSIDGYILLIEGWYANLDAETKKVVDKGLDVLDFLGKLVIGLGMLRAALFTVNTLLGGGVLGSLIKRLAGGGAALGAAEAGGTVAATKAAASRGLGGGEFFLADMLAKPIYDLTGLGDWAKGFAGDSSLLKGASAYYNSSGMANLKDGALNMPDIPKSWTTFAPTQPLETKGQLEINVKVNGNDAGRKTIDYIKDWDDNLNIQADYLDHDFSLQGPQ